MNTDTGPRSPGQAIVLLRIIGLSLASGVTLFAFVSWYLHQQQNPVGELVYGSLNYNAAIAMALLAAIGAFSVWRWRVAPLLEPASRETDWRARASAIQTGVIIVWALLEAGALVDGVVYLLTGNGLAGILSVGLIWVGVAFTWPKASWLEG